MTDERWLPRKLSFRAHGRNLVLAKRPGEKLEHRLMMALLWALYLPDYPELRIDVPVGSRYRPDLVQLDQDGRPHFWAEAGAVSTEKLRFLISRYRSTHLVFARWDPAPREFGAQIEAALKDLRRSAPIELIGFDNQAAEHIDADGTIGINRADVSSWRWE